jgi:tellurite methyltransferase
MPDRMPISDYFDKLYANNDRYWWREDNRYDTDPEAHPTSLLTQQTLLRLSPQAGRALDLGAGEGADAIRLARLGYEVDAVEISSIGADKIRNFARQARAKIRVITTPIQEFRPEHFYDVIICNGVLHYVKEKEAVIRMMQEATTENGLNVISLWSTFTPIPEFHEIAEVYCDDEHGIVESSYRDWHKEIFYFERDKAETSHSDLPAHRHSHIKLIARKPTAG